MLYLNVVLIEVGKVVYGVLGCVGGIILMLVMYGLLNVVCVFLNDIV